MGVNGLRYGMTLCWLSERSLSDLRPAPPRVEGRLVADRLAVLYGDTLLIERPRVCGLWVRHLTFVAKLARQPLLTMMRWDEMAAGDAGQPLTSPQTVG